MEKQYKHNKTKPVKTIKKTSNVSKPQKIDKSIKQSRKQQEM